MLCSECRSPHRAGRRTTLYCLRLMAFLTMAVVGCVDAVPPTQTSGESVRRVCPVPGTDDFYFPEGAVNPNSVVDERVERALLSGLLTRQGAPSLSCGNRPAEGYRMVWAGGAASPLVITVLRTDATWRLDWVQLSAPEPGQPGEATAEGGRDLMWADVRAVVTALEDAEFWSARISSGSGPEGLAWLVEGREGPRSRAVLLSPGLTPPFSGVARAFLALAGLREPPLMFSEGTSPP